jgi:hypothetical protein
MMLGRFGHSVLTVESPAFNPSSFMFEKSLPDLIRGIRANKNKEDDYISKRLEEIKVELKNTDHDVKATALAKLTYVCKRKTPSVQMFMHPSSLYHSRLV